MKLLHSLRDIDAPFVASIGNFDGLHLGHQNFLKEMLSYAKKKGLKTLLMAFRPHPVIHFKKCEHFLINTYEERQNLCADLGIDYFLEIAFNDTFSNQSASEFLEKYFMHSCLRAFFIGHDFIFGYKRKGTYKDIENFCLNQKVNFFHGKNFGIENLDDIAGLANVSCLSSTSIRNLLLKGDVLHASILLGRKFFLQGIVIEGQARGRVLGVPTINIKIACEQIIPRQGVYLTSVILKDPSNLLPNKTLASLTNIGVCPTFEAHRDHRDSIEKVAVSCETHILDFSANLYGKVVRVEFLEYLREEKKFDALDDLKKQIESDIYARKVLSHR